MNKYKKFIKKKTKSNKYLLFTKGKNNIDAITKIAFIIKKYFLLKKYFFLMKNKLNEVPNVEDIITDNIINRLDITKFPFK